MDRVAWQATVHGVAKVRHDSTVYGVARVRHDLRERERERERELLSDVVPLTHHLETCGDLGWPPGGAPRPQLRKLPKRKIL